MIGKPHELTARLQVGQARRQSNLTADRAAVPKRSATVLALGVQINRAHYVRAGADARALAGTG